MRRPRPAATLCLSLVFAALGSTSAQTLTVQLAASGLSAPLFADAPVGDPDRVFVLEQNSGLIRIVRAGAIVPTPFLNVGTLLTTGGERGLLGMAFHPNYASNGFFYVSYTNTSGASIVRRYQVSANPDVASTAGVVTIYGPVAQPFSNHNGGCIRFGADGMLYFGLGDGGSAGDPGDRAQAIGNALGKMLRFDVDLPSPYVPATNPFVGVGGYLPEIWALGLRNPWRFSFDRETGDLYIGDVGQNAVEEIDFRASTSTGGENYGWRCKEGLSCYTSSTGCSCTTPTLVDPVHTYSHAGGNCSVTGGYVYRGNAIPCLKGTYFFADYCSGRIWTLEVVGGVATNIIERTAQLAIPGTESITSFGEDGMGEIYIVDASGGELWKITEAAPANTCGDCDVDRDLDILDALQAAQITVRLVTPSTVQQCLCDVNHDGLINVLDALVIAQDSVGLPVVLSCP